MSSGTALGILLIMSSNSFCHKCFFIYLLSAMNLSFLYSETLRSNAQLYFAAMQWERWEEENMPAALETQSISERAPIAYAQIIAETAVYPSLPSIGLLDYHNVSNDILHFYDTIADGFLKKKLNSRLFNPQKPFLFHLVQFILDKLPQAVYVFYGKPVLIQKNTFCVDFKILTTAWAAFKQTEKEHQNNLVVAENASNIEASKAAEKTTHRKNGNMEKGQQLIPPLFSDKEPHSVIIEVAAVQKGKKWYIDHVDIKGAEYADSSLKN